MKTVNEVIAYFKEFGSRHQLYGSQESFYQHLSMLEEMRCETCVYFKWGDEYGFGECSKRIDVQIYEAEQKKDVSTENQLRFGNSPYTYKGKNFGCLHHTQRGSEKPAAAKE